MTIKQLLALTVILPLITVLSSGCMQSGTTRLYQKVSPYNYEETLLNLEIAIAEHNYRITSHSHIGQALRDRGEKGYPLSVVISFCNVTYAKEMMIINPSIINDMPCVATVREEAQSVIIGTTLMADDTDNSAQNDYAKKINANLTAIVDSAIE